MSKLRALIKFIKEIPQNSQELIEDFSVDESQNMLRIVKSHITQQDLEWTPLQEAYRNLKIEQGYDERIYLRTGEAFRRLDVHKIEDPRGFEYSWYIGGAENEIHESSGLLLNDLLKIHEYGTETIPSRPLFRPSQFEAANGRRTRFADAAIEFAKKKFKEYDID